MARSLHCTFVCAVAAAWLASGWAGAAEPTSETNERLRRALERFPEADLNGDGVLTASEARQAREQWRARQAKQRPAPPRQAVAPEPDLADVAYGPHERNVLDLWKAGSETPTPVVVFIHGGGFRAGDKAKVRGSRLLRDCLEAGVSFAAINYRFRPQTPVQEIVRDCARAIQFLRSKAAEWNIDPKRIASYGGSAGAGTSLWLAFHDDLADPEAADPVLRQSSRLACAGSLNGQASYDLREWEALVGPAPDGVRNDAEILSFYGFKSKEEMDTPEADKVMKDLSMVGLISKDDPPVFVFCPGPNTEPTNRGHYVHHPRHSIAIHKRCNELGVECELVLREHLAQGGGSQEERLRRFLFKRLGLTQEPQ